MKASKTITILVVAAILAAVFAPSAEASRRPGGSPSTGGTGTKPLVSLP